MGTITYITGGAKSGKSFHAEQQIISNNYCKVAYIATQGNDFMDDETLESINKHKSRRPKEWFTYEGFKNIDKEIFNLNSKECFDAYLFDCVTWWLNNRLFQIISKDSRYKGEIDDFDKLTSKEWDKITGIVLNDFNLILDTMRVTPADFWIVSNEVGSGIVPDSSYVRNYRVLLGKINQLIASRSDSVYISISGILLNLK